MSDKESLKEFIDKNDKLLSFLGVFAAITAYFSTDEGNEVLLTVAFFSLLLFLIACVELWANFPKSEKISRSLFLFRELFSLFILSVLFSFVYMYRNLLLMLLPAILFISFYIPCRLILNKLRTYFYIYLYIHLGRHRATERLESFDFVIGAIVFYLSIILALVLSLITAKPIIFVLQWLIL